MTDRPVATQTAGDFGKPIDGLQTRKTSLEPDGLDLGVEQTPVERFFVCNAGPAARVDVDRWSLRLNGAGAAAPATLGVDDLRALPWVEVDAWLECAGNGRRLFEYVGGFPRPVSALDTHWMTGAMGMARWGGVRLADVVDLVAPSRDLAWVSPSGLDVDNEDGDIVRMCLPVDKARDPDTIIALEMNGEPLTVAHGAPARLVVPGWIGAYSVKWLDCIELATEWVPSFRADTYYRLREPDGTDRGPATAHPVKSTLALAWDGQVPAGTIALRGYARSGAAPIDSVAWSLDDGPWQQAALHRLDGRWAWTPFEFAATLTPGHHTIRTCATDETGASQPETMRYHPNTILWNAITAHPVSAF
ncbi:MAG: molybdopterin-dependent oxidoreductase [Actinomycetota bacterium]